MNAANEQAVALFLEEKIPFLDIPKLIEYVCEKHKSDYRENPQLDDILWADKWAREEAVAGISIVSNSLTHVNIVNFDNRQTDAEEDNSNSTSEESQETENEESEFKVFFHRGLTQYEQENYQGALAEFNQALEIDPNHIDAYIYRGDVKEKLEDNHGAIADYNQAINIDSTHPKAYYRRGNVLRKVGDNWQFQ